MRTVRFRLTGPIAKADAMIATMHAIDGVDRVEEVADQMHERDDTSPPRPADEADFHDIEIHAQSAAHAEAVRGRAEAAARELGVAVEFVEDF